MVLCIELHEIMVSRKSSAVRDSILWKGIRDQVQGIEEMTSILKVLRHHICDPESDAVRISGLIQLERNKPNHSFHILRYRLHDINVEISVEYVPFNDCWTESNLCEVPYRYEVDTLRCNIPPEILCKAASSGTHYKDKTTIR